MRLVASGSISLSSLTTGLDTATLGLMPFLWGVISESRYPKMRHNDYSRGCW